MPRLLLLNHIVLLLCCSIFLGIGVSLLAFQLPFQPQLTVEHVFTAMTIVMLICGLVMLATEWLSGLRWVPVVVLVAVILATALALLAISPLDDRLTAGISDPAELTRALHEWAQLVRIRFALWIIEWVAMAYWFYRLAYLARVDR